MQGFKHNSRIITYLLIEGDNMAIKNRLLEIRLQMGYKKQKDFAAFLEINEKDYCRVENNKKQII
jgi:hypothetical protein